MATLEPPIQQHRRDVCCSDGVRRLLSSLPIMRHLLSAQRSDLGSVEMTAVEPDAGDTHSGLSADVILSRRQQKKQILREKRQERKGQKKVAKQTGALDAALESIDSSLAELFGAELPAISAPSAPADQNGRPRNGKGNGKGQGAAEETPGDDMRRPRLIQHLREAFRIEDGLPRYANLPSAHGPSPSKGLRALGSAILRPPLYTAKFLPQEYSLLHKMWVLLDGDARGAGVVDIGAGNANCAVLAAMLLGLTVICVERESPRVELRAEAQLPAECQGRVIRYESDIEDFGSSRLQEVADLHGLTRIVLVAKHPCGIGVDRSIDCAARLREASTSSRPISVVGAVLATCCTNKISMDDAREPRSSEFCAFYMRDVLSSSRCAARYCTDDGARACASLALERAVEVMSRSSAWRSAAGSDCNYIQSTQVEWAEMFEDSVQSLRIRRLKEIFGAADEVRFAPRECTLQDRCLLAYGSGPTLPAALFAHGEGAKDDSFVAQLQSAAASFVAEHGGPIDCRPKGLKSVRYGFDNTEDLVPPAD